MSKTSICIQMLQLLNTGLTLKVSELAEQLETTPRNIIEYKKELETAGFYIISIPGRYGGYKLVKETLFPTVKLTEKEKDSLNECINYINKKHDFIPKEDALSAFGKIMSNINTPQSNEQMIVVDKYQLSMNDKSISDRYNFIDSAIKQKRAIEIEYDSLKSGKKIYKLHPYKLFIYNNSWFFLAWNTDPEVGEVWYFKINRIINYKMLNEKFRVLRGFNPSKYFDEFGLKNNGEYEHIEFIAKNIRARLVKERVYGKNQINEDLPDGSVKVSLDMQNKSSIISFALSFGKDIQILSPQWVIDELKNYGDYIKEIY